MGATQQDGATDGCFVEADGRGSASTGADNQCRDDSSQGQQACGGGARDARHTGEAGQARGAGSTGVQGNATASVVSPGSLGAEEAEELVKKSQMLEETLRDVLATSTNLAGYLHAKDHRGGVINSGSQVAPVPELLSCCSPV